MKYSHIPVDTGRKLNAHNTFRRRPGRLLNILCTFNLRPVSTEVYLFSHISCSYTHVLVKNTKGVENVSSK